MYTHSSLELVPKYTIQASVRHCRWRQSPYALVYCVSFKFQHPISRLPRFSPPSGSVSTGSQATLMLHVTKKNQGKRNGCRINVKHWEQGAEWDKAMNYYENNYYCSDILGSYFMLIPGHLILLFSSLPLTYFFNKDKKRKINLRVLLSCCLSALGIESPKKKK